MKKNKPESALFKAIEENNASLVSEILQEHPDIRETMNPAGERPVHAAIRHNPGDGKIVDALIEAGSDCNGRDKNNRTALVVAIVYNDKSSATKLLDHGADVNYAEKNSYTPLAAALEDRENIEIARLLIDRGAEMNRQGTNGGTPLLESLLEGNSELALYLIEKGADISLSYTRGPYANQKAIQLAGYNGSVAVTRRLMERGVDINDISGDITALHWAAYNGRIELAAFLLEHNADPNLQDSSGQSPLHAAAEENNKAMVSLLLKYNADPAITDGNGETAADKTEEETVRELLTGGKDKIYNQELLFSFIEARDLKGIQECIDNGVDIDSADNEGITGLLHAVVQGIYADIGGEDTLDGYVKTAALLIEAGASLDRANSEGWTPLLYAAKLGNAPMAKLLIKAGADVNTSMKGETVMDMAKEHKAVMKRIKDNV